MTAFAIEERAPSAAGAGSAVGPGFASPSASFPLRLTSSYGAGSDAGPGFASPGAAVRDALDFELPAELEAREPPEARGLARDQVRLLITYRSSGRIVHARFDELPDVLAPGDLLVANDSATLPAALDARRLDPEASGDPAGETMTLHLSTHLLDGLWVVEPRKAAVRRGETLALPGGGRATLLTPYAASQRLWLASLELPVPALDYLYCWGRPIAYPYVRGAWPLEMYQTVFAREPGSAEMPSAGRAFTPAVLARLRHRGIALATITLHTGVSSLEAPEPPYAEPYRVSVEAVAAIQAARAAGGRVIAVGTTVVRALESAAGGAPPGSWPARRMSATVAQALERAGSAAAHLRAGERGRLVPSQGWTDLVVTPERGIRVVDGLITGFHEPRATHLAMLEALAGREHLERAYRAALEGRYLWHEFGDLHLLLP
jgi:S-adenosylmethionine:tRNA ribosyltransferase-isomerase